MHHATLNSKRLQSIYNALLLGTKTTKALQGLCNDMAVSTSIAELRAVLKKSGRGDISCTYQGRTAEGRKVYLYKLIKRGEIC